MMSPEEIQEAVNAVIDLRSTHKTSKVYTSRQAMEIKKRRDNFDFDREIADIENGILPKPTLFSPRKNEALDALKFK